MKETNGLAVASLVIGILALISSLFVAIFGGILGIISLILGSVSKNQIRESHGSQGGEGMATAGNVLGVIAIILSLVQWLACMAILSSLGLS